MALDLNLTDLFTCFDGNKLVTMAPRSICRLRRLLRHQARMVSDLASGNIHPRRRRALYRRLSLWRGRIASIVDGIHTAGVTFLLRRARRGLARTIIVLPQLDVKAMAQRQNSVLSNASRLMLATLRPQRFVDRVRAAVEELGPSRAILRDDAVEHYSTSCCFACGAVHAHGGAKRVRCRSAACPTKGALVSRDGQAAVNVYFRFCLTDTRQESPPGPSGDGAASSAAQDLWQDARTGGGAAPGSTTNEQVSTSDGRVRCTSRNVGSDHAVVACPEQAAHGNPACCTAARRSSSPK